MSTKLDNPWGVERRYQYTKKFIDWTKYPKPTFLLNLPEHIIEQNFLPSITNLADLLNFIHAYEAYPRIGKVLFDWVLKSEHGRKHIKNLIQKMSPLELCKTIQSLDMEKRPAADEDKFFRRMVFYIAGIVMDLLFCMETEVSEWESDWGVWHRDMVTIQQSVADYLSEAPEKIGIWYLKEAKVILPESIQDPTEDALNSYLHEFKMHTKEGHRRLTVLGAFTLSALYTFNASEIRVRIKTMEKYPRKALEKPADYEFPPRLSLPADVNMNDEEQYMVSELWEEYANFDDNRFWGRLNTNEKFSDRVLIANALCTRMDLASALYHSPLTRMEIYGLEDLQAFSHFDREHQIDWRFVGYSIMANGGEDVACDKILVAAKDLFDKDRRVTDVAHAKMVAEFYFCGDVTKLRFVGFDVPEKEIDKIFNKCDKLNVISVVKRRRTDYHRSHKYDDFHFKDL